MSTPDDKKRMAEFNAMRARLIDSKAGAPKQPDFFHTEAGRKVTGVLAGGGMGMAVGSFVGGLHLAMNGQSPFTKAGAKVMLGGGAIFAVIFGVGSLVR